MKENSPQYMVQGDESVNWLFLDLNAYFASVEQQERPELRGKPVGVVPFLVDNTCCIAASYEAKAFGVKTGVSPRDAKFLCPSIVLVEARPKLYVEYHHAIVRAVESCVPVSHIMSIDEMACRLIGRERPTSSAQNLALRVKQALRGVGETLRCSIGLAPNRMLAKVAGDMQKPDGLTILTPSSLPQSLYHLKPEDIPGIGSRMNRRLEARGIRTMEQLFTLTSDDMRRVWGGVVGHRMWLWLHGADFVDPVMRNKSIGNQHVLPPELRTMEKARAVGFRLLHKAAGRMRAIDMWARGISVRVEFMDLDRGYKKPPTSEPQEERGWSSLPGWEAHTPIPECKDTPMLQRYFDDLWVKCPYGKPLLVGVHLYHLIPSIQHTPGLFDSEAFKREQMCMAMDKLNKRYGKTTVYLGGMHPAKDSAPTRISYTSIPDLLDF